MRVAVLGLGLIGGSIGLAARQRAGAEVWGYDPDPSALSRALELGAIDGCAEDPREALEGADVVFLAGPMGTLAASVDAVLAAAGADCVISDVGSAKQPLSEAGSDQRFVGGHPLAGAETAGVEHARADLFEGATWYLTPAPGTSGVLYERLHRLLVAIGARPTAIDPETHDRLMATISHLPHVLANLLVAQALGQLASREAVQDEDSSRRLPAVGPSFRDATRVAGANGAIWTDIYISNGEAIIASIDELTARLGEVRELLSEGRAPAIVAWNEHARIDRDILLRGDLGGAPGEVIRELRVAVPNRPGVLAEIALALGDGGVNIADMALSPSPDNSQGVIALWIRGEGHAAEAERLVDGLGYPVVQA